MPAELASVPGWVWVAAGIVALIAFGKFRQRRETSRRVHGRSSGGSGAGFGTVAGCEEAIEDLREMVAFLADPGMFERFGATVPKGALLVGPPGTGKTLLARSVAEEAGVAFLSANGSDFVEMYVGVGAKRIRELYTEARTHDRAIVFIDEIDAVARRRGTGAPGQTGSGGAIEHENTLIALLTELDGFSSDHVITIAATNRPDVLDPAITRPGRLERRIEVPNPDRRGRQAILAIHTANKPIDDDVDLALVADRTPGMSGADLARVCNEAALTAIRWNLKRIDAACFDAAVELVALGRTRDSAVISERDREITAWHEAGHATIALLVDSVADPVAVSITPRGPAGGVTWLGSDEGQYMTGEQAYGRLMTMLGGRCAEEILLGGGCTQGAANDLEKATDLAGAMVARLGMTGVGLVVRDQHDDRSRAAVEEILDDAHRHATELLTTNRALLEAIVDDLLANQRTDAATLDALRRQHRSATTTTPRWRRTIGRRHSTPAHSGHAATYPTAGTAPNDPADRAAELRTGISTPGHVTGDVDRSVRSRRRGLVGAPRPARKQTVSRRLLAAILRRFLHRIES